MFVLLQEPLLKYRLPAVACPPPLLLQVTPVLPPEAAGPKQAVLFVVQYCVNPQLAGPLRDVTMTLQVPKALGQPSKVDKSTCVGTPLLACIVMLCMHCLCRNFFCML